MSNPMPKNIAWQVVEGHAILLDADSGSALGLNAVGTFIWSLRETHSETAIVQAVADQFDVDAATARADVAQFLKDLRHRGLLAESE